MSILKRKKQNEGASKPEIIYPNEFRRQLCTQAELAQGLIDKHIKGNRIMLDSLKIRTERIRQIYIVGSSENYPLALWASHNFEVICDAHTSAYLYSEFTCSELVLDKRTLVIMLVDKAQEDETAERIRQSRAGCVYIGDMLEEKAKLNIPVAQFTLKYIMLVLIALYIGRRNEVLTEMYYKLALTSLRKLRQSINEIMKNESYILSVADGMPSKGMIITGRNVDFAMSLYVAELFTSGLGCDVRAVQSGELDKIISKDNIIALASNDNLYNLLPESDYTLKIVPLSTSDSADSICYQGLLPLLNPLLCAIIGQVITYSIIYNSKSGN